jgi:hypothetical protein
VYASGFNRFPKIVPPLSYPTAALIQFEEEATERDGNLINPAEGPSSF